MINAENNYAFKEVIYDGSGKPKGNCDADLVLQAAQDVFDNNFEKALVVTSDGDYSCLIKFLLAKGKLLAILSPSIERKCSVLLKRIGARIVYINNQRSILSAKNEKAPDKDGTL